MIICTFVRTLLASDVTSLMPVLSLIDSNVAGLNLQLCRLLSLKLRHMSIVKIPLLERIDGLHEMIH